MTVKKIKNENLKREDREYRKFAEFEIRAAGDPQGGQSQELYVEGYAATFNEPTVMWEYDGIQYKEQIDDKAFNEADMSDVIFNYNHGGKVMARTRNKTLEIKTDSKGLFIRAKLDGTEEGRKLYEEIKGGYVDRMSFSFTAKESSYDTENHIRTIRKVKKLYDVSAVDIPAYDTTSISARSFFEAEAEKERKAVEAAELRAKLILRTQSEKEKELDCNCICMACNHADNCQSAGAKCCLCSNCPMISSCSKPGAEGCKCSECNMAENNCCQPGSTNCLCITCTNMDCKKGHSEESEDDESEMEMNSKKFNAELRKQLILKTLK